MASQPTVTSGASSPVASTASALSMGRGRGARPKQEPKAAPTTATKLGRIFHDDAESFKSEEFIASSRMETASQQGHPQRSLDHEELTSRLQVIVDLTRNNS